MNLFTLEATVGLDTTQFDTDVKAVTDTGEAVGKSLDDAFSPSADLGTFTTDFSAAMDAALSDANDVSDALDLVESKSELAQGVVDGFVGATQELVQKAIEGLVTFAADSLAVAAQSGSDMADAYIDAQNRLDLNREALQAKTGDALISFATGWTEFLNSLFGVTGLERVEVVLGRMEQYKFDTIAALKDDLQGIFGAFESVDQGSVADVTKMADGLSSQAAYWEEYAATLEAVKAKGVSADFLASIADGTVESLERLKAIETADASQLETLMSAYESLQATQEAAATAIAQVNLEVSAEMDAMITSLASAVADMDQSASAKTNSEATMDALIDVLARKYPEVEEWVNQINAKLATVGSTTLSNPNNPYGNNYHGTGQPRGGNAKGLDYVPENDFVTRLHRGEAVLTAREAEVWRAEQAGLSASGRTVNVTQNISAVPQSASDFAFETANALRMLRFNV